MIAALYVQADGVYAGLPHVDLWPEARDARLYNGPWPVVAHPPCERWGKFATGAPNKPRQYLIGDDGGCFRAALRVVNAYGGVIEHPAESRAFRHHCIERPERYKGWQKCGTQPGWVCYVEQGHYGHFSRKATWLYAVGVDLPELIWGPSPQRIHPRALELHGYEKARRIGMVAMIGGKRKKEIREATPVAFRDLLISIASTAEERAAT